MGRRNDMYYLSQKEVLSKFAKSDADHPQWQRRDLPVVHYFTTANDDLMRNSSIVHNPNAASVPDPKLYLQMESFRIGCFRCLGIRMLFSKYNPRTREVSV